MESALGGGARTEETITAIRDIAERRGVPESMTADMRRCAREAATEAAGWRSRWREEAVAFFEYLPRWSVERTR
ncbi:hypothetical protein AB0C76_27105 [Kitasatospora sp. NPDC048722]|uniref:hypothetical protein n=1 Tax=Kitasatospora sp. NPDC048722 TaxID=3155639 RepID=UPI0033E4BDE3